MYQKSNRNKRFNIRHINGGFPPITHSPEKKISDAILLAFIPIIAYSYLFVYETSFLTFFGVPIQFIKFDISEVFFTFSGIFWFFLIIFFIANAFFMLVGSLTSNIAKVRLLVKFIYLLYFLCICYLSTTTEQYFSTLFAGVTSLIFIMVIFIPPINRKYRGTFSQRLEQSLIRIKKVNNPISFEDLIFRKVSIKIGSILLLLPLSLYIVYLLGLSSAYQRINYNVINSSPECAVVYIRENSIVCVEFDLAKKEFDKGFKILPMDELKDKSILLRDIGPLRPISHKPIIPWSLFSKPTIVPTYTPKP